VAISDLMRRIDRPGNPHFDTEASDLVSAPPRFRLKAYQPPALTEAEFTRQVRDLLGYHGYHLVRNHVGTFVPYRVAVKALEMMAKGAGTTAARAILNANTIQGSDEGTADWFAIHPERRTLLLELKRRGGKLRTGQKQWLSYMLETRGYLGGCFDSLDDVIAWLKIQTSK
jgi:hypothetical protein